MMAEPSNSSTSSGAAAAPLRIETEERDGVLVVKIVGVAAVDVSAQMSRALQEAACKTPAILAIDLSELAFISSTGLGGIVSAHVTCQRNGTKMFLINPKPFIVEILNIILV